MNQRKSQTMLRTMFATASLAVGGLCFAQAASETVWAKQPIVIRDGKSGFAAEVTKARKGDQLTVLAREGPWLKIQIGDKQGYVSESVTSAKKVAGGGFGDMMAGGDSTSGMNTSAAAKGLDKMAQDYATSKNMNPKVVDAMMDRNKAITEAERQAFMAEGNVGVARK
jgi:hypothetical protein